MFEWKMSWEDSPEGILMAYTFMTEPMCKGENENEERENEV